MPAAGQHWRGRWLPGGCKSLWGHPGQHHCGTCKGQVIGPLIHCLSQHQSALILPRDSDAALCLPVVMEHTNHHLPPHLARKVRFWHGCEHWSAGSRSLPELCSSSWPRVSSCTDPGWADRPQPGQGNCCVPIWHIPSLWKAPPKAQRALYHNWLTYLTHLLNCYYTCWLITSSGNQRGHKFDIDLCKPAALQMLAGSGGLSGAWEKWGTENMALWKCLSLPHQPTAAAPCPNKMGSGDPRTRGEPPASHAWGASTVLPAPSAFLSTD